MMRMHFPEVSCSVFIIKLQLITKCFARKKKKRNGKHHGQAAESIRAPLSGNKYILSTGPTQLSSHHSCRQEAGRGWGNGGRQRGATDYMVVLAIYHLAQSRTGVYSSFAPPRDFHNRAPSLFTAVPFQPAFSHPHHQRAN